MEPRPENLKPGIITDETREGAHGGQLCENKAGGSVVLGVMVFSVGRGVGEGVFFILIPFFFFFLSQMAPKVSSFQTL